MEFLLLRFLSLVVLVAAEGFWDIQINLQSLKSVPFGNAHVSVWEHASTPGRYFSSPLVCLQPETATVFENFFTGKTQLDFSVLLWSQEAKESVFNHMKEHVNASIVRDQVELLPMEQIRLIWKNRNRPLPDFYQVGDEWRSNNHLPTLVQFDIACQDVQKCRQLETGMKTSPHAFNGLELEYQINAQKTARRRLVVRGEHLIGGELYTSLVNMPVDSGIRFLKSEDMARLASETTTNVLSTLTSDEDYVDEDDEVSVTELLRTVLQRQVVSTDDFQSRMWESVFWDSDMARPDKVTQYLNKVLTVDAANTSRFLVHENERDDQAEASLGIMARLFGASAHAGARSRSATKVEKQDIVNTIKQRYHDVQWSGERFIVKPMQLSRLNLASLGQSVTIASTRIQVKQYDSVKSIKLRTNCGFRNQTSTWNPQRVDFREQLWTQLEHKVETTLNNAVNKLRPRIEWPEYCYIAGHHCTVESYRHAQHTTRSACRRLCDNDSRCGAFQHQTYSGDEGCWLVSGCPSENVGRSVSTNRRLYLKMSRAFVSVPYVKRYFDHITGSPVSLEPCKALLGNDWNRG